MSVNKRLTSMQQVANKGAAVSIQLPSINALTSGGGGDAQRQETNAQVAHSDHAQLAIQMHNTTNHQRPPYAVPNYTSCHQSSTSSHHNHHHHHHHDAHFRTASQLRASQQHRVPSDSGLDTSTTNASSSDGDDVYSEHSAPTPPPNYHDIPGVVPAYQGRSSGPPPSYDEVVNPNAPPPSYQALFGQVREARKTSNGIFDLLRQLFLILIGTLGCTLIIGFLLLIPITMMIVGFMYVNECKAENIPSFLVIGGLVWIVKNVLNCYNQFKRDATTSNRPPPRRAPLAHHHNTTASRTTRHYDIERHTNNQRSFTTPATTNTMTTTTTTTTTASSNTTTVMTNSATDATQNGTNINIDEGIQMNQDDARVNIGQPDAATRMIVTSSTTTGNNHTRSHTQSHYRNHQINQAHRNNRIQNPSLIGITTFKCESMLNYFLIVWFLAGCIVVYRIYEPNYEDPLSPSYCHRTVYMYAFWLMTSTFLILAVFMSCLCCLMASSLLSCTRSR